MKEKKGQALVEFVIILPIFIFFLFAIIDVGKIISTKSKLENEMGIIVTEYLKEKNDNELQNIAEKENKNAKLEIALEQDGVTLSLKEEITIITPGLNLIFKNPYEIKIERWVFQ